MNRRTALYAIAAMAAIGCSPQEVPPQPKPSFTSTYAPQDLSPALQTLVQDLHKTYWKPVHDALPSMDATVHETVPGLEDSVNQHYQQAVTRAERLVNNMPVNLSTYLRTDAKRDTAQRNTPALHDPAYRLAWQNWDVLGQLLRVYASAHQRAHDTAPSDAFYTTLEGAVNDIITHLDTHAVAKK